MPYVTIVERLALKKGEAKGKAETLLQVLERRFAAKVPADLDAAIRGTTDLARLEPWVDLTLDARSLEEFRRVGQVRAEVQSAHLRAPIPPAYARSLPWP